MARLKLGRADGADLWTNHHVGLLELVAGEALAHDGESLHENVEGAAYRLVTGARRDVDGDDHVCRRR